MEELSLRRAILDDPEHDAPRLAYATWLEVHGHPDRADWIRVSCEYAGVPFSDERCRPLGTRVFECWKRCRPAWWEHIPNVDQENDRGIFRFVIGAGSSGRGPAPVKRLGKAVWLGQALDAGWLHRIELAWDDGELGVQVAKWKEPASRIPLLVQPAPQIDSVGLGRLLALPQLKGLALPATLLDNPATQALSACSTLDELSIELRLGTEEAIDLILSRILAMRGLRRLHLRGHDQIGLGNRPNDADLLRLARLPGLKRLYLSDSPAVTDDCIEQLRQEHPSLIIKRALSSSSRMYRILLQS